MSLAICLADLPCKFSIPHLGVECKSNGGPGWTRTTDIRLRRAVSACPSAGPKWSRSELNRPHLHGDRLSQCPPSESVGLSLSWHYIGLPATPGGLLVLLPRNGGPWRELNPHFRYATPATSR